MSPVDQPEAFAVVDEIGGPKIIVSEHRAHRRLRLFELVGDGEQPVASPCRGAPRGFEMVRIIAQDVKDPESRRLAAQSAARIEVAAAQDHRQGLDPAPQIGAGENPPLDEIANQRVLAGIDDARGETRRMGGAVRGRFAPARHMMDGFAAADAGDEEAGAVPHPEGGGAAAAVEGLDLDRLAPAGQGANPELKVVVHRFRPGEDAASHNVNRFSHLCADLRMLETRAPAPYEGCAGTGMKGTAAWTSSRGSPPIPPPGRRLRP